MTQPTPRQKAGAATAAISAACAHLCPAPDAQRRRCAQGLCRSCWHTDSVHRATPAPMSSWARPRRRSSAASGSLWSQGIAGRGAAMCPAYYRKTVHLRGGGRFLIQRGRSDLLQEQHGEPVQPGPLDGGLPSLPLYRFAGKPPRVLKGLVIRRKEETALCLRG
jgi:hypothetical protein